MKKPILGSFSPIDLHGRDVPGARVTLARQHLTVQALHGCRTLVVLHLNPRLRAGNDMGAETQPGLQAHMQSSTGSNQEGR